MSKNNKNGNKPDGLNFLAGLFTRIDAQDAEIKALKEALSVHENRLNSINIPVESVNAIGIHTLRMLGQMLLSVTEPQQQASVQEPQPEPGMQEVPQPQDVAAQVTG